MLAPEPKVYVPGTSDGCGSLPDRAMFLATAAMSAVELKTLVPEAAAGSFLLS
uniref:Uncharacterized protein n=1 Tax=Arundo donax TaxID=35708 RepID=A0A0A8ZX25_ARUDO